MKKSILVVMLVFALALTMTACGGGDSSTGGDALQKDVAKYLDDKNHAAVTLEKDITTGTTDLIAVLGATVAKGDQAVLDKANAVNSNVETWLASAKLKKCKNPEVQKMHDGLVELNVAKKAAIEKIIVAVNSGVAADYDTAKAEFTKVQADLEAQMKVITDAAGVVAE